MLFKDSKASAATLREPVTKKVSFLFFVYLIAFSTDANSIIFASVVFVLFLKSLIETAFGCRDLTSNRVSETLLISSRFFLLEVPEVAPKIVFYLIPESNSLSDLINCFIE